MSDEHRMNKAGNNPNRLDKDTLKNRPMEVESYYDILENEDNELLFTIKYKNSPRIGEHRPILYYDGGPHSILVKNDNVTIICDYVHPGVRKTLGKVKEILVGELDDGKVVEEYMADVLHVPGIEEIADLHVEKID
ncbi:MAG: hypothetical protein LBD23_07645 [Oscillospiraceae bacterium]|jgi:hypothetical protein|nr:hypothetical protein [Oscillospiraceae bacterium]